jgi:transcriptional regulator with GAF, ATPase, and Fis domain
VVNCGAIPESLVESELFGVAKGAFTGAAADRQGIFERANGGTVFLDEVGDLPFPAQVKLLRVLQEGEVERIGSGRAVKVDVRVIAATNVDLQRAVASKSFRKDLFDRLNVYPIRTTPLRERLDDLEELLEALASRRRVELRFAPDALFALRLHRWGGNIRELSNILERLAIISSGEVRRADVEEAFGMDREHALFEDTQEAQRILQAHLSEELLTSILLELQALRGALSRSPQDAPSQPLAVASSTVLASPGLGLVKVGSTVVRRGERATVIEAVGELLTVELEAGSGFLAGYAPRFEKWSLGEVEAG